jgi:hypothetical protein
MVTIYNMIVTNMICMYIYIYITCKWFIHGDILIKGSFMVICFHGSCMVAHISTVIK